MSRRPDRFCRHCGALLVRKRRPNGTLERLQDFEARVMCDTDCYHLYQLAHKKPAPVKRLETIPTFDSLIHDLECPTHLEKLFRWRQWRGAHWLFEETL